MNTNESRTKEHRLIQLKWPPTRDELIFVLLISQLIFCITINILLDK